MRQRIRGTRGALWLVALWLLVATCGAAGFAQGGAQEAAQRPDPAYPQRYMPEPQSGALLPVPTGKSPSPSQPPTAISDPPGEATPREPDKSSDVGFVFKDEVQEVVLHVTVLDQHHRPVSSLDQSAFHVYEDGKPQQITSFRHEDIPVALAIVIDNSGSMRDKRSSVNAAAMNLVRAGNPQDQICVVNFNSEFYLDQDYTSDVALLKDALERIESHGATALYDALMATSDHLIKNAKLEKKVILVVTDGEDTASYNTLEKAVRAIAVDGGPAVYAIGILGREKQRKARHALSILAGQTGGVAFFPVDVSEVESISQQVARDLRDQYTIAYKPSMPKLAGGYRRLTVSVAARGFKGLTARSRSGYYVTAAQTASASH